MTSLAPTAPSVAGGVVAKKPWCAGTGQQHAALVPEQPEGVGPGQGELGGAATADPYFVAVPLQPCARVRPTTADPRMPALFMDAIPYLVETSGRGGAPFLDSVRWMSW